MAAELEEISLLLERLLYDSTQVDDVDEVIRRGIATRDPEVLELAGEAICAFPSISYADPLWAIVDDKKASLEARTAAFTGIGGILMYSQEELHAADFGLADDRDEPLFSEEEIVHQVERLMRTYRTAGLPDALRRRALEVAANVSQDPAVKSAGQAALDTDDPNWIITGLLVVRLTDHQRVREPIEWACEHADQMVRLAGIRGLADLAQERDLARLAKIVENGPSQERQAALFALSDVPGNQAGEILEQATWYLEGDDLEEAEEAYQLWMEEWGLIPDDVFDSDVVDELVDDEF